MDRQSARDAVELLQQRSPVDAEVVAGSFASAIDAAEALAYLCGFLIGMHADAKGVTEQDVIDELLHRLGDDPRWGGTREPRRPLPPSGPVSARRPGAPR